MTPFPSRSLRCLFNTALPGLGTLIPTSLKPVVCRGEIKRSRTLVAILLMGMMGFAGSLCGAEPQGGAVDSLSEQHRQVLEMGPVGYWPADQGEGDVLQDLSDTRNPGIIHHVPWDPEQKLLDFTGAYQWLEIPAHEAYQTTAFSMGGWVFLRSEIIGSGWPDRQGMLLIGNRHWLNSLGVQLCIRRQEMIDLVSDGQEDVLETRLWMRTKDDKRVDRAYGEPSLAVGRWHHLLYAFEPDRQLIGPPSSPNLALTATVTASNDGGHPTRAPKNAVDGNPETSWVSWPGAGPEPDTEKWLQLDFGKEISINRIRLVNRPVDTDWFLSGKLQFSDGSVIDVPAITDEWDAMFATKQVQWVKFESAESRGARPGLREFGVYQEDFTVYQEEGVVTNQRLGEAVPGTGKLYLNGELIAGKEGISYKPAAANLQIGNDAYWWHQMSVKSGSLDGSVRDMVWFDRALSGEEAARLQQVTKPAVEPEVYDDSVILLDGRAIAVNDLASLPPATLPNALLLFNRKDAATLQPLTDAFLPILTVAMDEPDCRLQAASLLLKLNNDAAQAALRNALPKLVAAVQDQEKPEEERADAALALAAMGETAAEAVPVLADTLDKLVPDDGVQPPRVEELLRNALTRALLDIAPEHEQARTVVERTFAKPMIDALDTSKPGLESLLPRIQQGRYLEAMRVYAKLHHTVRDYFFTYKAPQDRDYTGTAHFNGNTYKVGTGIAWQGVEKVPEDEYTAIVAELAGEYPTANDWRTPEHEYLYRVPVTKITADGEEQKIYLEGRNFILDGEDEKLRAWSIFVDELGYVHLMGGQHNAPNPDNYIPGSWENMGVSRDRKSDDYPLQMYWVSTKPESIDSFTFVGQRSNPQAIPAGYLNYMVIEQSPSNEVYMYGRADAFGWQSWGMFRYDASARRWTALGGDVYDLINSARRHNPAWIDYLHDPIRGSVPKEPNDIRAFAWAWQPPFYNFCRDGWGVRFDKTGRLHVRMQISGLDGAGYVRPTSVYAWSDDRGETFHRADGSEIKLPLTVNPAPEHNAEIATDNTPQHHNHNGDQYATSQWWELWLELIRNAGFRI